MTMDTIYTGSAGTTCYINGERGTVTGFQYTNHGASYLAGAFIALDERVAMLYVELAATRDERHHEVTSVREINRDEFDRMTDIDGIRETLGWKLLKHSIQCDCNRCIQEDLAYILNQKFDQVSPRPIREG